MPNNCIRLGEEIALVINFLQDGTSKGFAQECYIFLSKMFVGR